MPSRRDVEISFRDKTLAGWHYTPDAEPPWPAIVMAHGFSGVKEQRLDSFAEAFSASGFAVTVIDFPNLGASTGEPRGDIDPSEQINAFTEAISWTAAAPGIDQERIGIWGTSYSGGHVLSLVSSDKRLKCAVAQVPFVGAPAAQLPEAFEAMLTAELAKVKAGGTPVTIPVVGSDGPFAALPTPDAEAWAQEFAPIAPAWRNEVTLASVARLLSYEPAAKIEQSSPVPLLVVAAQHDSLIPIQMVREVFDRAGDPKKMVTVDAGHFDIYLTRFDDAVTPEIEWFIEHL